MFGTDCLKRAISNYLKTMKLILKTALYGLAVTAGTLVAQEEPERLNLFQATDNPEERQNTTRGSQREANSPSMPAFTLVGTSRFGDTYYASLVSRSGESVQVEWTEGTVKEIDGFLGYRLADVNGRKVSIRLPSDENCVENIEKGVQCNGSFTVLTLTNATPIEGRRSSVSERSGIEVSGDEEEVPENEEFEISENSGRAGERLPGSNVLARNPFTGEPQTLPDLTPEEQAAREERRQRRAETFRNFEIVRIPDDEIPDGMQRIRTPFGDRLEAAEE